MYPKIYIFSPDTVDPRILGRCPDLHI